MNNGEDIFAELEAFELKEEESDDDESDDDKEESDADEEKFNEGAWTDEEVRLLLVGLRKYGKGKWMQISSVVKTRYVIADASILETLSYNNSLTCLSRQVQRSSQQPSLGYFEADGGWRGCFWWTRGV
jgi:hypothetical protein